jgi:hypothetical protein
MDTVDANDASTAVAPETAGGDSGRATNDATIGQTQDAARCPSVAEACAEGGNVCVPNWSLAQSPEAWCSPFPDSRVYIASHCDGVDLVVVGQGDISNFYYYDLQSGDLVGVNCNGAGNNVFLTDCGDAALTPSLCGSDGGVTH